MSDKKNVAVVEDEKDLCDMVCRMLVEFNYNANPFYNGDSARKAFQVCRPDICIIDLILPDMDGLDLVRDISKCAGTGVIVITARGGTSDRVLGLEVGADDYVVKPFEPRELVARVHSLVRRIDMLTSNYSDTEGRQVSFSGLTYDIGGMVLRNQQGDETMLSASEAMLMMKFLRSPKRVLSREQLFDEEMSSERQPFDRSIDIRVSRLRRKLERDAKDPQIIKTVYGAGYLFASEVTWLK